MILLWGLLACSTDAESIVADLGSANPAVRHDAVLAAADVADARVTQALVDHLNDADPQVRVDIYASLAKLADPAAVPALSQKVLDPDPVISRGAIDALGRIGDASAGPALIGALRANPEKPPLDAIWALGACKVKDAEQPLAELRGHSDPWVRYNADVALRAIDED